MKDFWKSRSNIALFCLKETILFDAERNYIINITAEEVNNNSQQAVKQVHFYNQESLVFKNQCCNSHKSKTFYVHA